MKIDVYDLGRTDVIFRILWLQAHNPKINWKTGEVKIMRYLPLCRRNIVRAKDRKSKKGN